MCEFNYNTKIKHHISRLSQNRVYSEKMVDLALNINRPYLNINP